MSDEKDDIKDNYKIELPDFRNVPTLKYYNYNDNIKDYSNFESLDKAINEARKSMFHINELLNKSEREAKNADLEYERNFRREFLSSNERTDGAKRARAALVCEKFENKKIMANQYKDELVKMSFLMKTEFQALQIMANNFRAEIRS